MNNKLLKKISLLSISIFLMSHLAIAPNIPRLYHLYSQHNTVSLAQIENLVTIPAIFITLFVLLSNFFVYYLGKKNTVLLGLILIFLSGLIPLLSVNFFVVLMSRIILGIGIGLFNSLSISMVSDYFEKDERPRMIGFRTACLNIGKAITTLLSGFLAIYSIKFIFLVYLLALPSFILFYFFIPYQENKTPQHREKFHFDKNILMYSFIAFLVGISYIGATVKIPTLLNQVYQIKNQTATNLLTLLAFSGIFSGVLFGFLNKHLKNWTLLVMILLMCIGDFLFTFPYQVVLYSFAAVLIGVSFVGIMSSCFWGIAQKTQINNLNFATSMILTGGNIGVILTPLILTKILVQMGIKPYITPFYIMCGLMLICLIASFIYLKHEKDI